MYHIALIARIISVAVSIASMADPTAMRWAGLVNFFLVLMASLIFDLNYVSAIVAGLTYLSGTFIAFLGFKDAYTTMPSIVEDANAIDSPRRSRDTPTRCRTDSVSSVESSDSDDSDQSSEYYCPAWVGEIPDDPLLEPLTLRWRPTTIYDDDTLHFMADLSAMQKYLRTLLIKQRRRARLAAA